MKQRSRIRAFLPLALLSFVFLITSGAIATRAATSPSETLWLSPFDRPLQLLQPFDLPNGHYQAGHRGIDLSAVANEQVRAPASGTVVFVGIVVDRPVITIRVDEHLLISLEPVESELRSGEAVTRGSEIGTVARGGHCDAVCLHLGVRLEDNYVNPMRYLRPRPVLLPW